MFGQYAGQNLPCQPAAAEPRCRFLFERAIDAVFDEFDGFIHHEIRCGHCVDQTDGACRFARKRATGQHHVESRGCAHQSWQTDAAAPARIDAEFHFRQADAGTGIIRRHACAAGQTQLGPSAHAVAVNQGYRWAGQFGDALEDVLTVADRIQYGSLGIEFGEFGDIGTSDETGFFGGADDQAFRRREGHALQQAVELIQYRLT